MTSRTRKVRKAFGRTGLAILLALTSCPSFGQTADSSTTVAQAGNGSASTAPANSPSYNSTSPTAPSKPWIVRDPATGRVFQQQLVPVSVPVTRWEARTIEQTVYEPRVATQVQQVPQTTYVPNTQYVMQPKVSGWWNPFKQPVQAYQYVPVTNWTPQTQPVANPVATQQWVPRQQKIVVYQPVQSTEIRQQLVQTEIPQPQSLPQSQTLPAATAYAASPRQPLFRLPILAQQRVLPWAAPTTPTATGYGTAYAAPVGSYAAAASPAQPGWRPVDQTSLANSPAANPTAATPYSPPTYGQPVAPPPQYATNGLRPVAPTRSSLVLPPFSLPRFASSPYSAPLQTTTSVGNTAARDALQSGMQPTVLR